MTSVLEEIAARVSGVEEESERALREILAPVASALEQVEAEITVRMEELKVVTAHRDRLKVVLEAAQGPKKKQKRTSSGPKPSPQSIEQMVRVLATKTEPQSVQQIADELEIGASSVGNQIREARKLDLVRHTGNGGETGRAKLYLVMPNAIKRIEKGEVKWP